MSILGVDGSELFYTQVGSGRACLAMHGGLGLDHTWLHPWLDPLGDLLQLVYYDHRGNGRSRCADPESITVESLCADADALRAHLGCERIAVIGHSYGSLIAMRYALDYPQRVSELILLGASPHINFAQIGLIAQRRGASTEQLSALSSLATCTDEEFGRAAQVLLPLYLHKHTEEEFQRFASRTRWSVAAFRRGAELAAGLDLTPRLGQIGVPTLIVAGDDDFITPLEKSEILHREIPNSELYIIPRSGHMPYFEQPEPFQWVVRSWLLKHAAQGRPASKLMLR
jgi:proline iminopeptidase